jgi:hypothetical protein
MNKFVIVNDTHFMAKSGTRLDIFPALLEKWDWVLNFCKANGAVLLHTGDFFNQATVPDEVKTGVMELISLHQVRVFCIYGNHDLLYNNEVYNGKTSLRVLELSGLVTIVTNELDFGGVSVAPLGVKTKQPAIVLGHAFLDMGTEPNVTMSQLDIYDKPTCVFLGHDHKAYPPAVVNVATPTIVYRLGGFIRQTVDCKDATPTIACVSFADGNFDVQVVPIGAAKPAVFISQSSHSIVIDAIEVGALISTLNTITTETKDLEFYLKQVATPEVLSYITTLK